VDLKVVRFIREASERQLVDIALVFIQRHPEEALELCSEEPEPGIEVTRKEVSSLPKNIFISEELLGKFQILYRGTAGDNKVAVVKEVRTVFGYGLREAVDLTDWLVNHNYLKGGTDSGYNPRF
jgi:ribosomal protein L7/L12